MNKWYEDPASNESSIISSRIRLARNIKKYPFSIKIDDEKSREMIEDVINSIKNDYMSIGDEFEYIDLNKQEQEDSLVMVERHEISPEMLKLERPRGILLKNDESIDIMINEEDHIRIQVVYAGKNIDKAWDMADKIDDLIEESVEYAYDRRFGYLTSCPSNTGTGLRASYIMHLPFLESTGNIRELATHLSKMGMTIRGIYGEGSESFGSIYQISNQTTLGKSEKEIIDSLKTVGENIRDNETKTYEYILSRSKNKIEDDIYRSYGLLKYSRSMTMKEAMNLLSAVRVGYNRRLLTKDRPEKNIYNIMMDIEPGNIGKKYGAKTPEERDFYRAKYLREIFK